MDDLRPRGPGRLVLQALAITSAIGFLTLLMVQASAFYAPPPKAAKKSSLYGLRGPSTKAAPVLAPQLRAESEAAEDQPRTVIPPTLLAKPRDPDDRAYLPATKAGILGPLKVTPSPPAPPSQATPPQR